MSLIAVGRDTRHTTCFADVIGTNMESNNEQCYSSVYCIRFVTWHH